MKNFEDLRNILKTLRSPGGCPWDLKQTHESLLSCLLEETNEVSDAILNNNKEHLKEELGDLLLQVVFHSQMASETGDFTIDNVINDICEKLIRRHPHVFGGESIADADGVIERWNQIKQTEKQDAQDAIDGQNRMDNKQDKGLLDSVPKHFPPLLGSFKYQKEAAKAGFDWPDYRGVMDKIDEELSELKEAINSGELKHIEHEIGDMLFSLVNLGRFFKVHGDVALTKANKRFKERFAIVEDSVKASGKEFADFSLDELDLFWNEAKKQLKDK